jgi:RNA polymerase sigma-70 factor (ECF subfamily)
MPGEAGTRLLVADRRSELSADEDDDALVAAARRDSTAFATLYHRYVDAIYRYCHRRLGNREAAQDATSLVFTKALDALPRYRERGSSGCFRSWLFAIAHNTIANDLREIGRQNDRPIESASELADPARGPEEIAIGNEARGTIQALLALLSDDERRLLELRLSGLSGPEIAHVLGRSHGAVKVAQFRAIARLRALIDRTDGTERVRDAS